MHCMIHSTAETQTHVQSTVRVQQSRDPLAVASLQTSSFCSSFKIIGETGENWKLNGVLCEVTAQQQSSPSSGSVTGASSSYFVILSLVLFSDNEKSQNRSKRCSSPAGSGTYRTLGLEIYFSRSLSHANCSWCVPKYRNHTNTDSKQEQQNSRETTNRRIMVLLSACPPSTSQKTGKSSKGSKG